MEPASLGWNTPICILLKFLVIIFIDLSHFKSPNKWIKIETGRDMSGGKWMASEKL